MKKLLWGLGGFVGFCCLILAALPWILKVDRYRPALVSLINERINGKIEIGELRLKVWGKLEIAVDGIRLIDPAGKELLRVSESRFKLPLMPLINGNPELTLQIVGPELHARQNAQGQWNWSKILKTKPAESGDASPPDTELLLPPLVLKSHFGLELLSARLSVDSQNPGADVQLNDLNVFVRDLSLSAPFSIEVTSTLKANPMPDFAVAGPFRLSATIQPVWDGVALKSLGSSGLIDFGRMSWNWGEYLKKSDSVPGTLEWKLNWTETEIDVPQWKLRLSDAEVSGLMKSTRTDKGLKTRVECESSEWNLTQIAKLSPVFARMSPSGSAHLKAAMIQGPEETALKYVAALTLGDLSVSVPSLKDRPSLSGKIKIKTDEIESIDLNVHANGTQAKISGSVRSFTRPQIQLSLASPRLDLGPITPLPPDAPTPDRDALVAPLKEMAQKVSLSAVVDIGELKWGDYKMNALSTSFRFENLVATIERLSMQIWKGEVSATGRVSLNTRLPSYSFQGRVKDLDTHQAISEQMALFKNTAAGKLQLSISGTGSSFNTDQIKKNLAAKGQFKLTDAVFTSIDVGRMVEEAINKAIEKTAEKIPPLKGKRVDRVAKGVTRYEFMGSDFLLKEGEFSMPNFAAKARVNQGFDITGKTRVGLLSSQLDARWRVMDRYDLTRAKDLSVSAGGVTIPQVLTSGTPPLVVVPVTIGCKLEAPCYSYEEVPAYFAQVVSGKLSRAGKEKVNAAVQKAKEVAKEKAKVVEKKVTEEVQKNISEQTEKAPEAVKKLLGPLKNPFKK